MIQFVAQKYCIRELVNNVRVSLASLTARRCGKYAGEVPKAVSKMGVLVGFGNPLLDVSVKIQDDDLLKKYNLNRDDQKEISIEEMSNLLKDISRYEIEYHAGGCAQNTLRILQWLMKKSGSTYMFGAIGNDAQGEMLKQIVEGDGVITRYITQRSYATGISVDLVRGADRSLVANIGAAEHFTVQDFLSDDAHIETLMKADYVYVEGFFLTHRVELSKFILNCCNENKKPFVFNISGVYMCELQPEDMKYFGEKCDVLFGNAKEYAALSKIANHKGDIRDFAIKLVSKHPKKDYLPFGKIVVVTNGSKSVICAYGDGNLKEMDVPKIDVEQIRDTTGAGDSFVSGFLAGIFNDKCPEKCLAWGCWVSQKIIQEYGCTVPSYPSDQVHSIV